METFNKEGNIFTIERSFKTPLPIKKNDVVEVLDEIIMFRDDLKAYYGCDLKKIYDALKEKDLV